MSKARLVITAVTVEKRPVSEVAPLLRGRAVLGLHAAGPLRGRGRGGVRAAVPAAEDLPVGDQRRGRRADHRGCARNWPGRAWTPGRRPSPGTWSTTTRSRSPRRRSAATWPGRAWSPPTRPSGRSRPTSGSRPSMPNECWQSDFTHYPLADGTDTEILTWLDDHSRYALSVTAHARVTGPAVLPAFRAACAAARRPGLHPDRQRHGLHHPPVRRQRRPQRPRARAAPPRRQAEERQAEPPPDPGQGRALPADHEELAPRPAAPARHPRRAPGPARRLRRHLQHPPTAPVTPGPRHPRHCLQRPAQGQPRRPRRRHPRPRPHRPHRPTPGSSPSAHNGRLYHIGIGRPHAGTRVLLLVQDLHIRVINADTGELIRELILNPDKTYQPTGRPSGWPKKTPRP